jgi:hypothetical protein
MMLRRGALLKYYEVQLLDDFGGWKLFFVVLLARRWLLLLIIIGWVSSSRHRIRW